MPAGTTSNFRRPKLAAAAIGLSIAIVAGACGSSDDDGPSVAASDEATTAATVVIDLVAYSPEELDVSAGTTVTWRQQDAGAHTVTSGTVEQGAASVTKVPDGQFDSGDLANGDSFEFTFSEPGTYPYFCSLHPATMRGEIRVN